jgi:hypothetical protein
MLSLFARELLKFSADVQNIYTLLVKNRKRKVDEEIEINFRFETA